MNFLTEHKIEQYADLSARLTEWQSGKRTGGGQALKEAEKRLTDMTVLVKNDQHLPKRPSPSMRIPQGKEQGEIPRRTGSERLSFMKPRQRSLKAAGITKLPSLSALQAEYAALQAQKEALYADYGKLKKQVREYDIIKQNIDSILTGRQAAGTGKGNRARIRIAKSPPLCYDRAIKKQRSVEHGKPENAGI